MLSAELVRSVLDSAPDAILIIDAAGNIRYANHQATALFGYAREQIVGQSVELLLPQRFRERHIAHRRQYGVHPRVRPMGIGLDLFALRADGTEFPVEISLSPIHDGDTVLTAAAIRDVSERLRVQQQLQNAQAQAERANRAKSRFLAAASHDLRQPLQSLALLNGALQRLVRDPEALDALAQQSQAIGMMSRLLNALLDISKLDSGTILPDIRDFDVGALLHDLRAEFSALAASKGLSLTVEATHEVVRSDAALTGQILRNLISNAIKYTERGFVRLECAREGDLVRVAVRDSGVGIPQDQLESIFEEFYQLGPIGSREGYGLGLSIVQRLAALLQLRIDVSSQVGAGSTFSVLLPAGTAAQGTLSPKTREAHEAMPSRPTRRHVLLVEDDAGVRNATRVFLKTEGYRVTVAASLAEALQQVSEESDIDVVVSDYHLGGDQTGLDLIAAVRERVRRPLGAVLMTGDTSPAVQGMRPDERLRITSKPINADALLAMLGELIAQTGRADRDSAC